MFRLLQYYYKTAINVDLVSASLSDSHMEMKSPKLFYAAMHKVMVALIGDSLPSPPPKPLAALSARTPSRRGPMELVFNDDLSRITNPAFATPQLDRAR